MAEKHWVSVDRVRRVRMEVPKLAAVIEVSSTEDHKCRGWGTPHARIEGPAPGEFTVSASHVEDLHEALKAAFEVFDKEFGS